MSAVRFFDTNILVYAFDLREPAKRDVALDWVQQGWKTPEEVAISIQVLQELYNALCKLRMPRPEALRIVQDFENWPIMDNTLDVLRSAWKEQERWNVSLWDSLILAAARAAGATELISEDFSHGQDYGGIRVVNPFRRSE